MGQRRESKRRVRHKLGACLTSSCSRSWTAGLSLEDTEDWKSNFTSFGLLLGPSNLGMRRYFFFCSMNLQSSTPLTPRQIFTALQPSVCSWAIQTWVCVSVLQVVLVLLTFLNCCMSTLHLVHYALLLTPACWRSNNTNARLMVFTLSLPLDPTFGIHSHQTLDTAQPCHLLKPN